MVTEEIRKIKSGRKELRDFGITLGALLGLLGGLLLWKERAGHLPLLIAGGLFVLLGLLRPAILKPVYKAWMVLAVLIGWVMTRVILGLLFFLLVTPIGLAAKLFGKDLLETRFGEDTARSYWIRKERVTRKTEDYERQF